MYCIDIIRNINLLSFVCKTCVIYVNILIVVSQFFFTNLCSILMMFHQKYRFNRSDSEQYRHRYRTEVTYRFRFLEQTVTDTGTGEP